MTSTPTNQAVVPAPGGIRTLVGATMLALLVFVWMSGCQTTRGAGQDIENLGEGIQNAAERNS